MSKLRQNTLLLSKRIMSWQIYVDGASSGNPGDSGAGMVIFDGNGTEISRDSVFLGKMTNNMAEYEALLRALEKAQEHGAQDVVVYTDSLLVANQVIGTYKINNDILRAICGQGKKNHKQFRSLCDTIYTKRTEQDCR